MTKKQKEAQDAVKEHGSQAAAARALGITSQSLNDRLKAIPGDEKEELQVSSTPGGFSLKGRVLLAKKPTDVWKARFHALERETGYTLELLADQWGNSLDTIKSKAKRFDALRYLEDPGCPGKYIAVVVHPATLKGR